MSVDQVQELLSAECPVCGEDAAARVVGYEFVVDVTPAADVRYCTVDPRERDESGGALYLHIETEGSE